MSEHQQRFQALLRELFQFDSADLDFGIYRIMNHKRDVIERYISEELPQTIADELSRGMLAEQATIHEQLAGAREEVGQVLGPEALDSDGNLHQAFHETPVGARYLSAQSVACAAGADVEPFQAMVYNHLYNFFSRYYDDGDFISKRRYSRRERYAIPYNGEEVLLHWANKDQYYVKTGEHFRNYAFKAGGISVSFVVVDANVEQGNVKGKSRYFFPCLKAAQWREGDRELLIPFEFRPATVAELKNGKNKLQESNIEKAVADLPQHLDDAPVAALTTERHRNGARPVTVFEYHLRRYTRRNTTDFFIHKDLKGFLTRELDFYLKNEVLNIDGVETTDETTAEGWVRGWFQTLRMMRTAAGQVIDFLDQAESFQKMIWEKRKFVTDVQYVIPVGLIDERHHSVIAENEAQWTEWRQEIGVDKSKDPDLLVGSSLDRRSFLASHPTLTIDTKHFDADFVDLVLHNIDDLDNQIFGLLIHSENQQALALLTKSLSNRVDCVYIDPPYNAPSSEIVYKNDYKHSSWLSLMESRIAVVNGMLTDAGVFAIAIDENEQERLGLALSNTWLGNFARTCVTVRHNPRGIQGTNFSHCHEFVYFMYPDDGKRYVGERKLGTPDVRNLRDSGTESRREDARNCFYPIEISRDQVLGFGDVPDPDHHPEANERLKDGRILVWPIDSQGTERKWRYARASVEDIASKLEVRKTRNGLYNVDFAKDTGTVRTIWDDSKFDASEYGTKLLQQLFGTRDLDFSYPKSLHTVMEAVRVSTGRPRSHVLDYFAGSGTTGHAVIALNREDGFDRRFTLVEVEAYFDTVLLARIKKTMFASTWKAGLPTGGAAREGTEWSPGVVKYVRLESYEDALNNIEFDDAGVQRAMELEDYVIKYMLKWETRDSATLLNIEELSRPFDYKLATHANGNGSTERADVAETFNYLLGLRVRTRKVYYDDERKYLVYRGVAEGQETVVVWRETAGWEPKDYRRDQQFLVAQKIAEVADVVYTNGVCFLAGATALEPLFKERMFAPLPS